MLKKESIMRILSLISPFNPANKIQTPPNFNSNMSVPLSFKGDSFEKSNDSKIFEDLERQQRKELYKILAEIKEEKKRTDSPSIYKLDLFNDHLDSINKQYKKLNEMLSRSSGTNQSQNYAIIVKYLEGRANMAADKGFNRIVGSEKLKGKLRESFCMDTILNDKLIKSGDMKDVNVPDMILFYGPTGTGKTTFAIALGEEAQTYTVIPDWNKFHAVNANNKKMEIIKDLMQRALENYNNSSDKKRTIIVLNEVDSLISSPDNYLNPVKKAEQEQTVKEFIQLAQNCAKDYKCTLFLTTNEPQRIDKRILDKEIMPVKIGIEPSSNELLEEILKKKLSYHNITVDTNKIMEALIQNQNGARYSNSDIESFVNSVIQETNQPKEADFIEFIEDGCIFPGISPKNMKYFYEFKNSQKENIGKEWKELA